MGSATAEGNRAFGSREKPSYFYFPVEEAILIEVLHLTATRIKQKQSVEFPILNVRLGPSKASPQLNYSMSNSTPTYRRARIKFSQLSETGRSVER